MLTFRKTYFILSILLFIIEVLIALFAHDEFIRPYVGDLLVVVLLYCLVKSKKLDTETNTILDIHLWLRACA